MSNTTFGILEKIKLELWQIDFQVDGPKVG